MRTLGLLFESISRPITKKQEEITIKSKDSVRLYLECTIKNVGKVEANGKQTVEGFVLIQGSHISIVEDDTIPVAVKERRKKLLLMNMVYCKRICFSQVLPTLPCSLLGKVPMDLISWKNKNGQTLKSLEIGNGVE